MARNKYPEETVKKILDAAGHLFTTKGYDDTSLQEIITATKLSKGAIYHHFASKEQILLRLCERIGEENAAELRVICGDPSLNGAQKLQAIFRASLLHQNQERMIEIMPPLIENPCFLAAELRSILAEAVPFFIQPVIEQGIADGSIRCEHPGELAEALIVLSDLWLSPVVRPTTPEQIYARCALYNQLTEPFGLCLLDAELIEALVSHTRYLQQRGKSAAK